MALPETSLPEVCPSAGFTTFLLKYFYNIFICEMALLVQQRFELYLLVAG